MGPVGGLWGREEELRLVAKAIARRAPLVLVVGHEGDREGDHDLAPRDRRTIGQVAQTHGT